MRKYYGAVLLLLVFFTVNFTDDVAAEEWENSITVMQAVNFDAEDLDGKPISLQDYKGQKLLLMFFTTWCDVCQQELPILSDNYETLKKEEGIDVLAVNMATSERKGVDIESFATGLKMPIIVDRDGRISKSFGVQGIPTTYAIDEQQQIVKPFYGALKKQDVLQAFE